nr:PREDICTED: prokineticin-1 [Apteryx mantelli mantelli]
MTRVLQGLCLLLLLPLQRGAIITGVPFFGKRQHHACPCLPNLSCSRFGDGRYRCSLDFKSIDV